MEEEGSAHPRMVAEEGERRVVEAVKYVLRQLYLGEGHVL